MARRAGTPAQAFARSESLVGVRAVRASARRRAWDPGKVPVRLKSAEVLPVRSLRRTRSASHEQTGTPSRCLRESVPHRHHVASPGEPVLPAAQRHLNSGANLGRGSHPLRAMPPAMTANLPGWCPLDRGREPVLAGGGCPAPYPRAGVRPRGVPSGERSESRSAVTGIACPRVNCHLETPRRVSVQSLLVSGLRSSWQSHEGSS